MKISFNEFLNTVIKANHFNTSAMLKSYRIIYYKSGSGQAMIGSSFFKFKDGMYAVIAPNEMFEGIVTSQAEEMICEFIAEPAAEKLHSGIYADNDNLILKQFEKIRHEHRLRENYRDVFLDLFSAELYYLILRNSSKTSRKAVTIRDIVEYIDENFYEDIKVEDLAKKAGYTCRHFRNLFLETTGLPPSEYLLKKRLEISKKLLLNTSQNIVEVSQSCGFSSASQFAMFFKRYTQMTPSEFRNCNITA